LKVLVAEDDFISRRVLEVRPAKSGYEVVTLDASVEDPRVGGRSPLAILVWMMPGLAARRSAAG
jgi:hypothetical protein